MKTKQSLHVLIAALGSLLVQSLYPSVVRCAPPNLTSGGSTNAQATSASTNIVNEAGCLYKTFVNKDSGQYALVDTNKEAVILKDSTGKIIWSIRIATIAQALEVSPRLRGRTIQGMQMDKGVLWLDVGRGFAVIDVKTGTLRGIASN